MTPVPTDTVCPICGGRSLRSGLECRGVPAHTVVLHHSREDALSAACGDVVLACCEGCGFVFNATYDASLHHYSDGYESTQAFSQTFNTFNESVASEVADSARQNGGSVVEIGCGQGEFLYLLKERGCEKLIGFDPAYDTGRSAVTGCSGIEVLARGFDPKAVTDIPRTIVCKMTLEHIAQPLAMLRQVVELASRSSRCEIFVQVPNAGAIFSASAFWDIYYEHCNYFTAHALAHTLCGAGLVPVTIARVFADEYLMARARLAVTSQDPTTGLETVSEMESFERFCQIAGVETRNWRERIGRLVAAGERILLWGGGSKAVAFISFTRTEQHLLAAIDINPRKSNTFLPGSGLPVIPPTQAKELDPTVIILLNPVYRVEVERECSRIGIEASIIGLNGADRAHAA